MSDEPQMRLTGRTDYECPVCRQDWLIVHRFEHPSLCRTVFCVECPTCKFGHSMGFGFDTMGRGTDRHELDALKLVINQALEIGGHVRRGEE